MATHSRILAWKIPWAQEPGRLQSMGVTEFSSFFTLPRGLWNLSSPPGLNPDPNSEGTESSPLDSQGIPKNFLLSEG